MPSVILDPGHGGEDPGAVYQGRQEKDDALALAMAVGEILANNGVDVAYTRTNDIYETPFKKATDGNQSGADLFISIHRNSGANPNTYNGTQALVYQDSGIRTVLANNINSNLVKLGFKDNGIVERPNLVVLRRTGMPAVLMEVGFINNDLDNRLFDEKFDEIARAIADGILTTLYEEGYGSQKDDAFIMESQIPQTGMPSTDWTQVPSMGMQPNQQMPSNQTSPMENMGNMGNGYNEYENMENEESGNGNGNGKLYRVQVGAYRNKESADRLLNSLLIEGFPAFIIYDDGLFKVQVGAFSFLANAIRMEERLRRFRYNTYITT